MVDGGSHDAKSTMPAPVLTHNLLVPRRPYGGGLEAKKASVGRALSDDNVRTLYASREKRGIADQRLPRTSLCRLG